MPSSIDCCTYTGGSLICRGALRAFSFLPSNCRLVVAILEREKFDAFFLGGRF